VIVECVAVVVDDIGRVEIRVPGLEFDWLAEAAELAWAACPGSYARLVERT
jgi:hypothetical protein